MWSKLEMLVGHPQRTKSIQAVKIKKSKAGGKTSPCSSVSCHSPSAHWWGHRKESNPSWPQASFNPSWQFLQVILTACFGAQWQNIPCTTLGSRQQSLAHQGRLPSCPLLPHPFLHHRGLVLPSQEQGSPDCIALFLSSSCNWYWSKDFLYNSIQQLENTSRINLPFKAMKR